MSVNLGLSRRDFLAGATATAALARAFPGGDQPASSPVLRSPFRVSVINDEISEDFGRSCEVAARQFGMRWIELRGMWQKNIVNLDAQEVAEAQRILKKYELRVTDIASPLFKVAWKDDPRAKERQAADFHADFTFAQQEEVLERSLGLAQAFATDRVRCFDFWRMENPAPYREAINATLRSAAEKAGKLGIILLLENDGGLNTSTGAEAAKVLHAVESPHLMLNWDPGNAAANGERAYPDGYNLLPKERIGHCHCKDAVKQGQGYEWAAMGTGIVDWRGQFAALKRDGYHFAVSLETHWNGGTPEESSRRSWSGMKDLLEEAGAL